MAGQPEKKKKFNEENKQTKEAFVRVRCPSRTSNFVDIMTHIETK